jgi:glutamate-1-semialdehyde aminotransferase
MLMPSPKGTRLWKKAKTIIPGGTQLLSKRAEMFLPELWPSYYSRADGVDIWDIDGNHFTDMSIMGVGACILGYADKDVNRSVRQAIDAGSMATLCCPEEVELAELLLSLHPWAGMVRYARTGGEAMAVAVRIARASTGRDTIAFCGYHGWHDWYLSSNLADERSLDDHLLPGLSCRGVPRGLKGSALTFSYNRIQELEEIAEKHELGAIVMEPLRHHPPKKGFLEAVRRSATDSGAVLVFDEITTGWKMKIGGVHDLHGVQPDLAVYGKAMSNGYPMAAIVGREVVMQAAQESFISSTYWTERVGPAASLATIRKLQEKNVPRHLISIGEQVGRGWEALGKDHGLPLQVMGIPPLATFALSHPDAQALYTLFTQEFLERGYLASKGISVSFCHSRECIEKYLENVDGVFALLEEAISTGTVRSRLKGPVAHEGFKRLT